MSSMHTGNVAGYLQRRRLEPHVGSLHAVAVLHAHKSELCGRVDLPDDAPLVGLKLQRLSNTCDGATATARDTLFAQQTSSVAWLAAARWWEPPEQQRHHRHP